MINEMPKHKKKRQPITVQRVVFAVVFFLFCLYFLSMLLPFVMMVGWSLEDMGIYEQHLARGSTFWFPTKLHFSNYITAFSNIKSHGTTGTGFFGMIGNSLWYTAIAVAVPLVTNTCVGYVIAKYRFKARPIYYGVIIFCMTVPVMGNTAATMKLYSDLGLYNTGPLLLFVTHLGAGGMTFLVMYAFFRNISWEYAEAAFIDGAGNFTVLFRIMFPMAVPAMGAMAILNGITAWNSYMDVLIYNRDWPTLASGLYTMSVTLPRLGYSPVYYAALVIALVPILVIFCFFSDKIMKNFTVGGLKG